MEIDNGGEFLVRGLKALVKDAIGELDMIGDNCVLGGDKLSALSSSNFSSKLWLVGNVGLDGLNLFSSLWA